MFSLKSLATRHDMIMYICCLLAFVGVVSNGVGMIFALCFLGMWVGSWGLFQTGRHTLIPLKVWNVVILLSVAGTAGMMYLSDESIINSGVRFILMLIGIKLLSRRGGERDDWQIYALTFLLMAAGTAVNEDIIYGFVFALYVLFGTFGLAMLHLRTEQDRTGHLASSAMNKSYGRILLVLAGMVFASSMVIFFTFPRVGLGFFAAKSRASVSMTGFSDQVELGSHGVIRDNPEVVMRVEFEDDVMPVEALGYHWRMMSFDRYDGVQWLRSSVTSPLTFSRVNDDPHTFNTTKLYTSRLRTDLPEETRHLEIYMEPLAAKQLPQLWPMTQLGLPESIPLSFNPNSIWLRYDNMYHDVYMQQRNELGVAFSMELPTSPSLEPLQKARYEPMEAMRHKAFLQLPEGVERMEALTAQLVGDLTTPYAKALAIESHLQTSYTYTTNLPPVEGNNPVESFLFATKQGHCEFFATAMTLMMRSQGVPARLVNGFLGGAWNSTGNYMAVRQGDAHSWVEVYMPEYGWVPFDPTPSAGTQPLQQDGVAQRMRDVYDAARMRWMQWVIEYNLDAQLAGLRRLSNALSPSGGSSNAQNEQKKDSKGWGPDVALRDVLLWLIMCLITLCGAFQVRFMRSRDTLTLSAPRDHIRTWTGVLVAMSAWTTLGALWMGYMHQWTPAVTIAGGVMPLVAMGVALALRLRHDTTDLHRLQILFTRIEKLAQRHQITRRPDEGPQHFLTRLITHYPTHGEAIARFTRHYLRVRFGEALPSHDSDMDAIETMAKHLLHKLAASTPAHQESTFTD